MGKQEAGGGARLWRRADVEREKARVKAELDAVGEAEGPVRRLHAALSAIRRLESETGSKAMLSRFVYSVSALVHHLHHGGLSARQIDALAELGDALLKIQGIKPQSSQLSFLYGDLHLVLSQIYRREGKVWDSTWEQLTSYYLSQRAPTGGLGFQAFTCANQAVRLGHGPLAETELERAWRLGVPAKVKGRVLLERVKTYRLTGKVEEAERIAAAESGACELTEDEARELRWEAICRRVARDQDIRELVTSVRRGGEHHSPPYILEAFLWTRAVGSREWLTRLPKLRSLARHGEMNRRRNGLLYDCAMVLETAYDTEIPADFRLHRVGTLLHRTALLPTIDLELLLWAAIIRWLVRTRASRFASFALAEYRGRSLRLSGGSTRDVLGLLSDLDDYGSADPDEEREAPPEAASA